ncbi:MAG: family 16 glycosylhydrolase [bacterium]|nr:family 16 glycosylhydrolase [bacterium]
MNKFYILFISFFCSNYLGAQEFLRWSDEFNGTALDTNYWEYQIGDGCPDLCGWGNAESQSYQRDAVKVEGGFLKIKASKEKVGNSNYRSARIRSIGKMDFASGRIVVRARLPIGKGYWPAIWFLPTESYYGNWPLSGEIDLMEGKGQEPKTTHGTIHYGAYVPNNKYTGTSYTLATDSFTSGFHDFGLRWTNDSILWYVDGVLFSTKTRSNLTDFWWPFDRNFHAIINLAVGGYFLGYPDATTPDTATLQVDYIRVYQDLKQIFISGPDAILRLDKQKEFYTQELAGATYAWQVPAGAQIIGASNGSKVKVNWGLHSDSIGVLATHNGFSQKINKYVLALPDTCEGLLDNVETLRTMYWVGGSGTYRAGVTNPMKDFVNTSNSVNRYYRSGGTTYDALFLHTDVIDAAKDFEDGKLLFKMKLYTTAPVGTEVNLNFENRKRAESNYPLGRRCVLQAKTTKDRAWEELTFKLILKPDPGTLDGTINQLVLLFAPNTSSSDVYFMDDFGVKEAPCKELLNSIEESVLEPILVYPNPLVHGEDLRISFDAKQYVLRDILGRTKITCSHINELNAQLGALDAGTYFLWMSNGKREAQVKILKVQN